MAAAAPTRSDSELGAGLSELDPSAWEELYALYGKRLYAFRYRLSGDRHDAADLVQETLVRALRASAGPPSEPPRARTRKAPAKPAGAATAERGGEDDDDGASAGDCYLRNGGADRPGDDRRATGALGDDWPAAILPATTAPPPAPAPPDLVIASVTPTSFTVWGRQAARWRRPGQPLGR